MTARILPLAAMLLASGCARAAAEAPEPPVQAQLAPAVASPGSPGVEQIFRGRFVVGFERSSFDGCWVDQGRYGGTFETPPAASGGIAVYEVEFRGRRTDMVRPPGADPRLQGFGHMGRYSCQIEMTRLVWKTRLQ